MDISTMIRSALGGSIPGVQPRNLPATRAVPIRKDLRVEDGDAPYDTEAEVYALITNTAYTYFKLVWQRTVPAQQLYHWGYGSAALPYNQGFMWFAAVDSGTGFAIGVLRLLQSDANGEKVFKVGEWDDGSLHTATSTTLATATPTLGAGLGGVPLPEHTEFPWVGEDSLLQITYRLVTATTAIDASNFRIPASIRQ